MLALEASLHSSTRGGWTARELEAVESSPDTAPLLQGLRECLPYFDRVVRKDAPSNAELSKVKFTNFICVASKVCPDEAIRWYKCVQGVSARRGTGAANFHCSRERRRVERCTERVVSLMVSTAIVRDKSMGHS